jgi:NTE family protein
MKKPPMSQVFGVALNSIFLDHLDTDLEHLNRMNDIIRAYGAGANSEKTLQLKEPMKLIDPFIINPSHDLASIAEQYSHKMPGAVRYLLEGLGNSKAQSSDLMSYLLFDSAYTRELINVGYNDANERIAEIEDFLWK